MKPEQCVLKIRPGATPNSFAVDYSDTLGGDENGEVQWTGLTEETVNRLHRWASQYAEYCKGEDLRVLGLHLFHILFDSKVAKAFADSYEKFEKRKSEEPTLALRVRLIFTPEARKLAEYPWEFIYVPLKPNGIEGSFLAKLSQLVLTRFVLAPAEPVAKLNLGAAPVRILIVAAHPSRSDGKPLDSITEEDFGAILGTDFRRLVYERPDLKEPAIKVREEGRVAPDQTGFDVRYLPNATFEALTKVVHGDKSQNIDPFKPHILHFIGHGRAGEIGFEKPWRKVVTEAKGQIDKSLVDNAEWIKALSLSEIFGPDIKQRPRLVFLNACLGAKPHVNEFTTAADSFARGLVCNGIPAVIAMRYKTEDRDAIMFAQNFYENIGQGMSVGEAFKAGILALGTRDPAWDHPRFGTPVFFLQADDDAFLDRPQTKSAHKEESQQKGGRFEPFWCPKCLRRLLSPGAIRCPDCKAFLEECPRCHNMKPEGESICQFCPKEAAVGLGASSDRAVGPARLEATPAPAGAPIAPAASVQSVVDIRTPHIDPSRQ